MDTCRVCFHWATTGTPGSFLLVDILITPVKVIQIEDYYISVLFFFLNKTKQIHKNPLEKAHASIDIVSVAFPSEQEVLTELFQHTIPVSSAKGEDA